MKGVICDHLWIKAQQSECAAKRIFVILTELTESLYTQLKLKVYGTVIPASVIYFCLNGFWKFKRQQRQQQDHLTEEA